YASHLFTFNSRIPHSASLFPYPTLFRSARQLLFERIKQMDQGDVGMTGQLEQLLFTGRIKIMEVADNKDRATGLHQPAGVGKHLDRKSTRLNSSHVKISYAVFCLKKKKD